MRAYFLWLVVESVLQYLLLECASRPNLFLLEKKIPNYLLHRECDRILGKFHRKEWYTHQYKGSRTHCPQLIGNESHFVRLIWCRCFQNSWLYFRRFQRTVLGQLINIGANPLVLSIQEVLYGFSKAWISYEMG